MHHIDRGANLLIHSIKFGENDAINSARIRHVYGEINQRLIKLSQLINGVIADQSFTHEEHHVWRVDMDQLSKLTHEALIALHPAGCIDQDDIIALVLGFDQGLLRNHCRVILVAFLV